MSTATFVEEDVWSLFEQLARALRHQPMGLQATLDAIVADAVTTIEPASYAGLILVKAGV